MERKSMLLTDFNQVVSAQGTTPLSGKQARNLQVIKKGAIYCEGETVIAVGSSDVLKKEYSADLELSFKGKIAIPGLIDPHTHLIFDGVRDDEFSLKLQGHSYMEILKMGGGITRTVRMTRAASKEKLVANALQTLNIMLQHGTTTIEAKSGYGLTTKDEIKSLEAIRDANEKHPIDIVSTFLGAHAIPEEYNSNIQGYVDLVVNEMLPAVAERKLARYCDVFCEEGVFSVKQSREILLKAKKLGLVPRLHADEIVQLGGSELAGEVKAISADHLLQSSEAGIREMVTNGVIGVLLPGTPFSLMMKDYPNARFMIDSGLPLALATDLNPNCFCYSQLTIMTLACYNMKMFPEEALIGVTLNAACAIEQGHRLGTLEPGKQSDIVIVDLPNYTEMTYKFGYNCVNTVIKKGEIVHQVK